MSKKKNSSKQLTPESGFIPLTLDSQVKHYIQALKGASARISYVMIAATVVSIFAIIGLINSLENGWFSSRLELARAAAMVWESGSTDSNNTIDDMKMEVSEIDGSQEIESEFQTQKRVGSITPTANMENAPRSGSNIDPDLKIRAIMWIEQHNITSIAEIEDIILIFEEVWVHSATILHVPILGIVFDINDLGMITGISFVILMIMLVFSISRYHENLFLSIWFVRDISKKEEEPIAPESMANLVYHSLAMTQIFNNPPTLARYKAKGSAWPLKVVFITIPIIQGAIFIHDISTIDIGQVYNTSFTIISLLVQVISIIINAIIAYMCWHYVRASGIRWKRVFNKINPHLRRIPQPSWREWVFLDEPEMDYQAMIKESYDKARGNE